MKIWVDGKLYDPSDGLIAVVLTDKDKENISNMHPDASVYSEFDGTNINDEDVKPLLMKIKKLSINEVK